MADSLETPSPRFLVRLRTLSRVTVITVIIAGLLLIAARAILPSFLKHEINLRLSRIPGYAGHVDDVGVQVWHGGYRMYDLVITKGNGAVSEPFIAARRVQFSIAYRELLHGRVVSDIELDRGRLNFVRGPTAESSQLETDKRWQDVINDLFPIDITHLRFREGQIRFVDTTTKPKVDIAVNHMDLVADGLQNRPSGNQGPYPARIAVSGETIGGGHLNLRIEAEPLALQPHFKLTFDLRGVSLPALNDFLLAYANTDVGAGTFDAYLEAMGANGEFQGYVKPFFKNLTFSNPAADEKKNLWQVVWKELVTAAANLLKNRSDKEVATLVPFSGKFHQGMSIDFWHTLRNLLHNGFVEAIREGLEGSPTAKKSAAPPPPEAAGK